MGGTLSCAGKGHVPSDQDNLPYGTKVNGTVPQKTDLVSPDAKGPDIFQNTTESPRSSWKVWQRLSLRRRGQKSTLNKDSGFSSIAEEGPVPDGLPDVVDKTVFRRSKSLKPPPKPPRLFLFRSSTISTQRNSLTAENDRHSFIQSEAYQRGSHVSDTKTNVPSISGPVNVINVENGNVPNLGVTSNKIIESDCVNNNLKSNLKGSPSHECKENPEAVVRRRITPGKIKIVTPDLSSRRAATRMHKRSGDLESGERHVLILQCAWELVCQKVDPFSLLEDLLHEGVLTDDDLKAFRGHPDRRLICENIVQTVLDGDYSTFIKFCEILRSFPDYVSIASVLDAMKAVYDLLYEIPATIPDGSPVVDDEKTVNFDIVYFNTETGKVRSVVELERARTMENKRFSRDLMSYKRSSRLSFHSIASEISSSFGDDIISNGIPMITVSIAGHSLHDQKSKELGAILERHFCILELHVGKTHLRGPDIAHISAPLHAMTGLTVLDLRLNPIGNSGATSLARALQKNVTLRHLNISSTGIDSEGCKVIAESLKCNYCLQELDMSFLDIGDDGSVALGNVLKQNRTLCKLRLRSCSISWLGCGFLLEGIEQGKSVSELDLSRNFIGDDGAEMISRHLDDLSSLVELNLENCGFTSAGCAFLSDVILTNKSLSSLDLSVNFIGDQGVMKLSTALERNKYIRTLGLNMCGITNDGFSTLLDILEINPTLTLLKLCYNRLGREHTNPAATSDDLRYRVRIVTSSNPKLKLLLWGNTFEDS